MNKNIDDAKLRQCQDAAGKLLAAMQSDEFVAVIFRRDASKGVAKDITMDVIPWHWSEWAVSARMLFEESQKRMRLAGQPEQHKQGVETPERRPLRKRSTSGS